MTHAQHSQTSTLLDTIGISNVQLYLETYFVRDDLSAAINRYCELNYFLPKNTRLKQMAQYVRSVFFFFKKTILMIRRVFGCDWLI